ncbi:MmcQ/YjbR family DNA-binding protein [Arthrobacter crusticola]|uniref:MmcQ/YjbR family DNA-binding protein n=1 Tax=Arthrobacter crusticola TaxID=2547960 RepID=A0A4R5TN45_9MICC|nr:MmcQ/YjbR family DNA-binding protein [Arthrobacter crusticola]TDK24061.1 MmcQ/YjbR family DNA-binding protein [Arthrobacter crusticola]
MDFDWLCATCLSFPGAYEDYPFGPETAVFRVRVRQQDRRPVPGKIFALVGVDADPLSISLKCDPALAVQLRAAHPEITGAWHLNKRHWNGVRLDGSLSAGTVHDMIEDSYDLIVASLPAADREGLGWSTGAP